MRAATVNETGPSLAIVAAELSAEINEARAALEAFAERTDDPGVLERCALHLHAVHGALRLAEVYGSSLLAEEMELVARHVVAHTVDGKTDTDALDALMRAMEQLPAYVDRVLSGGRDVPIALLPLLNDLRAVRGSALLSEGALLMLNLRSDEPAPTAFAVGAEHSDPAEVARKQRPRFQVALLGWIRAESTDQNLDVLADVAAQLESSSTIQPVFQLWWVVGAVLEALRHGGIQPNVSVKRLLGQVDREMRRLYELGEKRYADNPPIELLNNLLFYVGRATGEGPRVAAVRKSFRLDELLPAEGSPDEASQTLSAPSVRLMKTVAAAIREDLTRVKDVLDIFVRKGANQVEDLVPQLEMLRKISDTLGVLGLGALRDRVQGEIGSLRAIVDRREPPDDSALLRIAAALIEVEDSLDDQLVRLIVPDAARQPAEPGEPTDAEFRQVQSAVLRECIVNMARIKEAVTHAVAAPAEAQGLDQVPQLVRGITAGLLMLGKQRAVELMEGIGRALSTIVRPDRESMATEKMDRLADAIVAIEYYMETLQAGRSDPWNMLDNAQACLDAIGALRPAAVVVPFAPAAAAAVPAPIAQAARPVAPQPVPVVDAEFLQLFIEEARENVAALRELFPRWEQNPLDEQALRDVRRVFHTLKGSGRMVGAVAIGEFSWSVEFLLNRVINQTIPRSAEIVAVVRDAVTVLPVLISSLEEGVEPPVDYVAITARADAISGREATAAPSAPAAPVAPVAPVAEVPVEGAAPETVEAEPAAEMPEEEPAPTLDPVLRDIFRKETAGHIAVVRDFIARSGQSPAPHAISEALYRACHTLSGIAKTAGIRQGVKIAEPMDHYVRKLYDNGHPLPAEGLSLLQDTVHGLESVVDHIEETTGYFPDHLRLIAGWHTLERALDAELARLTEAAERTVEPLWQAAQEPSEAAPETTEPTTEPEEIVLESTGIEVPTAPSLEPFAVVEPPAAPETVEGEGELTAPHLELPQAEAQPEAEVLEVDEQPETEELPILVEPEAIEEPSVVEELPVVEESSVVEEIVLEQPAAEAQPEPAAEEAVAEVEFDADIAAIFSEEASELLEQSQIALTGWVHDRADSSHVTELKRLLHTLKGGARMAGILAMGDLSHEVESFLGGLESGAIVADAESFAVLQASLDQLHAMRESAIAGQRIAPARELIARVRALSSRVPMEEQAAAVPEPAPEIPSEVPVEVPAAPQPPIAAEPIIVQPPAEVEPAPVAAVEPTVVPPEREELVFEIEAPFATPAMPPPVLPGREPLAPVERHELARVDAELLDTLLNSAGEVSIFRARVEQQMTSIEFNLAELGRTVTRLREQLRKLELETEAQILYKHHDVGAERTEFDPLELDRYSTIQQLSRALAESVSDVASIEGLLENLNRDGQNLLQQQGRVITELQNGLMKTRMVPFERHVQRLSRLVRQAAQEADKKVELAVEGASGELDRQVLERMLPPFEHMLRNAVVHGIETPEERVARGKHETGRISVTLRREGAEVVIVVADDGAGMNVGAIRAKAEQMGLLEPGQSLTDEEALQLVLEPGFSTADRLTQQAGRGVGMDVVATEVKKLGGALFIESEPGRGARFTIRLPFTLAITQALIVKVHDELYALPVATVEGVARVPKPEIDRHLAEEHPSFEYGGQVYRFQHLGSFLGSGPTLLPDTEAALPVILVRAGEHSTALVADDLVGSREIVVKSVGPQIASIRGISGATILGDGRIIVILDMGALVRSEWRARAPEQPLPSRRDERIFAMVVDDSITVRRVTQRLLERNGMRVLTAKDGVDALSLLQEHVPDVILLDIEMPRMDGYEVASHVRNDPRLVDVPIIMITSRVGDKHRARAIELGVDDYLGKPYQESQLLDAIEPLVLSRRRLAR